MKKEGENNNLIHTHVYTDDVGFTGISLILNLESFVTYIYTK